jgi:hypothetical protein
MTTEIGDHGARKLEVEDPPDGGSRRCLKDDKASPDAFFNGTGREKSGSHHEVHKGTKNLENLCVLDFGELPSGLTSASSVESSLRVEDSRAVSLWRNNPCIENRGPATGEICSAPGRDPRRGRKKGISAGGEDPFTKGRKDHQQNGRRRAEEHWTPLRKGGDSCHLIIGPRWWAGARLRRTCPTLPHQAGHQRDGTRKAATISTLSHPKRRTP